MAERSGREQGVAPAAMPGRARTVVGLVCAEIDAALAGRPLPHGPDGTGLRCRYQLTEAGQLRPGLAGIVAMLAEVAAGAPASASIGDNPDAAAGAGNGVVVARGRLTTGSPGPAGRDAVAAGVIGHVVVLSEAGGLDPVVAHAAVMLGAGRLTVAGPCANHDLGAALRCIGLVDIARPGEAGRLLADAAGLIQIGPAGVAQTPVPAHPLRAGSWLAEVRYRPVSPASTAATPGGHGTLALHNVGTFRLAAGADVATEPVIRYLATLTGTMAGNAGTIRRGSGHAAR